MSRPHDPLAPAASMPGQAPSGWRPALRRWPVVLGVAGLLALAAAAAWLLRPGSPDSGMGKPGLSTVPAPVGPPAVGPPTDPAAPATVPAGESSRAAVAPPRAAAPAPAGDAGTVGGEGMDDAPPATVDSPQARRAWLERIRELRDAGELEAAHASLEEYRRRYPGLELPGDLRGLLSE